MSATKEQKPKTALFHISLSLFKNKRIKRRLAGKIHKKSTKKRPKTYGRSRLRPVQPSETIEISTDEEGEKPKVSGVETSIVLSSGDEDEATAQNRIFPMLPSDTTVRTSVGNTVYELSLSQLKENLEKITNPSKKKQTTAKPAANKTRLNSTAASVDVSISLLSDEEEDNKVATPPTSAEKKARTLL